MKLYEIAFWIFIWTSTSNLKGQDNALGSHEIAWGYAQWRALED